MQCLLVIGVLMRCLEMLMCRPNCIAKLVDMKGQHRVFIFATQQIAPMEELTYALLPWAVEPIAFK